MFDVVDGLPVHALVVHAVVVLLPLMALVSVAFVVRPKWRAVLGWAVLGNVVVLVTVFAAKESGEKLAGRLSGLGGTAVWNHHQHLAVVLPWFALGQLVASAVAWALVRPGRGGDSVPARSVALALALTLLAGAASVSWCYRVGESGARAVWGDTIKATHPAQGG